MTTPDPDRKSAPFEWRALTVNKVEKIQLARLREEQDRIESELREQEALEREARRLEAQDREREAAEQAWFAQGTEPSRDALEERDTHREAAVLTPLKRLGHSLTAFAHRVTHPPAKPRTSVPPPPLNDSPVSLSLVLAACAFGGSVYLSLRWVAEVRQANVTQQLTSSVNATAPEGARFLDQAATVALPGGAQPSPASPSARPTEAELQQSPQQSVLQGSTRDTNATVSESPTPAVDANVAALPSAPVLKVARSFRAAQVEEPPAAAQQGQVGSSDSVALPLGPSQSTVRSRVLVPASGSPHSSGPRVYRGGE